MLQAGKLKARLVVRAGLLVGIQQAGRGGLEAESRPPALSYSGYWACITSGDNFQERNHRRAVSHAVVFEFVPTHGR